MEHLLDCEEEDVSLHYVLVEKWREVEKILKPTSLISKIWNAWSDEQANVKFSVKRIKHTNNASTGDSCKDKTGSCDQGTGTGRGEVVPPANNNNSLSQRRVKRRNSKTCRSQRPHVTDTLHPKALAKTERQICSDIETMMRKIIVQGESIRAHLVSLQAGTSNHFCPQMSAVVLLFLSGASRCDRLIKQIFCNYSSKARGQRVPSVPNKPDVFCSNYLIMTYFTDP